MNNKGQNSTLVCELDKTKKEVEQLRVQTEILQKAIWDMLNYANMFVLLLDEAMNIVLINYSLATKLGFNNEKEPIGRCWLDFIKPKERELLISIHRAVSHEEEDEKYREVITDMVKLNGETCRIKWFNTPLNHESHMTFSFGIPREVVTEITEESIRTYYTDIIEKDKTMIMSLRDSVLKRRENTIAFPPAMTIDVSKGKL